MQNMESHSLSIADASHWHVAVSQVPGPGRHRGTSWPGGSTVKVLARSDSFADASHWHVTAGQGSEPGPGRHQGTPGPGGSTVTHCHGAGAALQDAT